MRFAFKSCVFLFEAIILLISVEVIMYLDISCCFLHHFGTLLLTQKGWKCCNQEIGWDIKRLAPLKHPHKDCTPWNMWMQGNCLKHNGNLNTYTKHLDELHFSQWQISFVRLPSKTWTIICCVSRNYLLFATPIVSCFPNQCQSLDQWWRIALNIFNIFKTNPLLALCMTGLCLLWGLP